MARESTSEVPPGRANPPGGPVTTTPETTPRATARLAATAAGRLRRASRLALVAALAVSCNDGGGRPLDPPPGGVDEDSRALDALDPQGLAWVSPTHGSPVVVGQPFDITLRTEN